MKPTASLIKFAPIVATLTLAHSIHAADGTWTSTATSGNWINTDTSPWFGGIVADGSTSTALFTSDITDLTTITLTAPRTIGNITFSDNGAAGSAWTIAGANILTLGDNVGTGTTSPIITTVTNATISSIIQGNDGLTKTGAGTLVLSGTGKTYTGTTQITVGTLQLSNIGTTFVSPINVATNATLELNSTSAANSFDTNFMFDTGAGAITGTGTITKTGGGVAQYRNTTTFRDFAGTIDIQAGTFGSAFTTGTLGKDGSLMTVNVGASGLLDLRTSGANAAKIDKLTGTGRVGTTHNAIGGSTLTVGTAGGSSQFDGVIMGSGGGPQNDTSNPNNSTVALVKVGAGTFTLTGSNTYAGTTTLSGGTLALNYATNNTSKISDNGLILNDGTLTLAGATGSHTEVVGNTTLNGGVTINRSGANTSKVALGAITRNAGGALEVASTGLATTTTANVNGILRGVTLGGVLAANDGSNNIVAYSSFTDVNRLGGTIADGAATNVRIIDGGSSGNVTQAAAGTTTINTLSNNATAGLSTVDIGTGKTLRLGAVGTIAAASGTSGLTISNGTLTAGGADNTAGEILVANQSANAITVNSVIANNGSGAVSLTKSGTGTLTLSGLNTYTGGTTISEGTLKFDLTSRPTSPSTVNIGNIAVNASGTLELYSGSFGGVPNAKIMSGGNFSGSGVINKTGSGAIDLWTGSGIGSFTGQINIQEGMLMNQTSGANAWSTSLGQMSVDMAAGTYLDLRTDGGIKIDKLTGSGTIGSSFTAGMVLSVGNNHGSSTFSGVIQNTVPGFANTPTVALIKNGSGTFTLSGTNTFTGNTTVTAGTLNLANTLALSGSTFVGGAGTLGFDSSVSSNTFTLGGLSGSSALTLQNNAGSPSAVTLAVGNNNAATTYSGVLSGTGGLTKIGTGTLTLGGVNTNTGTNTVSAGTLKLDYTASTSRLADTSTLALGNGTLELAGGSHAEVVGSTTLVGAGTITRSSGTSTINLNTITRNTGASLNLAAASIATTDTLNDASGILGGWATVGGTDWAINSTNAADGAITAYTAYTDVPFAGSITDAAATNVRLTGGVSGNVTLGSTVTTVNTLLQSQTTATTIDTTSGTLRLGVNGGILVATGKGALTIGMAANAGVLTAGGADNTAGDIVFNNTGGAITVNSTLTNNGSGVVGIGKAGTNTLTLNGTNTFSGGLTLNAGTLVLGNTSALGTGTLTINGGTIDSSVANLVNANNNAQVWNGNFTFTGTQSLNLGTGAVSLGTTVGSARTITTTANTLTIGGVIADGTTANGLTKLGAGTLILTGSNTYTGTTTVSAGVLSLNNSGGPAILGNFVMNGADGTYARMQKANQFGSGVVANFTSASGAWNRFELNANSQTFAGINTGYGSAQGGGVIQIVESGTAGSATLTLNGTGNYFFNGHLRNGGTSNTLSLTKSGSGTQTLVGNVISYTGNTIIDGGTLKFSDVISGQSSTRGAVSVAANAVFEFASTQTTVGDTGYAWDATSYSGAGTIRKTGTGSYSMIGQHTTSVGMGAGALIDVQAGTLTLNFASAGVSFASNKADLNIASGATFNAWDANHASGVRFNKLTGGGTYTTNGGTRNLIIGVDNGTGANFNGVIQTAVNLTKTGTGTQTLSGANTYTGATTITGGTLRVNGSTAAGSVVSVASGATLGGTGTIGGTVNVTGVLAPGASIESLAAGSVTMNNLSTLEMEIQDTSGTGADLLAISGDFSLSGLVTLQLSKIGGTGWTLNDKLTLASYTNTWNGGLFTYLGNAVTDDSQISFDGQMWTFNYNDTVEGNNFASESSGSYVTMTAIPEPNVAALLGGMGVLALLRRRRN